MMHSTEVELLDVNCIFRGRKDYVEPFKNWFLTGNKLSYEKAMALFLNFIGLEAYAMVTNLTSPAPSTKLSNEKLKKSLLGHHRSMNFVATEREQYPVQ